MVYALIGCLIIIGFLGIKLSQKQKIDRTALNNYKEQISQTTKEWNQLLKNKSAVETELNAVKENVQQWNQELTNLQIECNDAKNERICEETHTESLKQAANEALQRYHDIVDIKMREIDTSIEEQRQRRQEELNKTFEENQQKYDLMLQKKAKDTEDELNALQIAADSEKQTMVEEVEMYQHEIDYWEQKWQSIINPIKSYEKTKQEKLFYTVQLPEEYQSDIEFLLTTVAAKVQHPDIISKLIWQEYVKPNLDNTFKRIEVKAEPGIYKLTSLANGKCYVGKSTDVKRRLTDHFKSVIGISSIADQAVHHAIRKEGFWNWTIEIITYCDKEQLSDLEKYYIEFFKAQEYGYNKTGGG